MPVLVLMALMWGLAMATAVSASRSDASPSLTSTPSPSQCVGDANGNGVGDVVDVETTASELGCVQYLPLVVAQWRQPWPTPTPTPTATPPARFGITRTSDRFTCNQAQGIGAQETWIVVPWKAIEPAQDQWNFADLDALVDAVEACGLKLSLKLKTGQGHWGVQPGGNGQGSMPPRDLNDYYDWVYTTVSRYRGRVRAYAIENEVNAPAYWAGTLEDYKPVWQTGYAAVKAADPDALVVDFGMTSTSYGIAIARWRYEHGDLAGAIEWLNRYLGRRFQPNVQDADGLRQWIYDPNAMEDYDIMMWHFQMQPRPDAYQLHFYEPWDLLPDLMAWIRDRMRDQGYEIPIEVWEIGYYWGDDATYDPAAHARDVPKLLLTALGEGATRADYLPYVSARLQQGRLETVRGLVDADLQPRPAYDAYRRTAQTIGTFVTAERLSAGPDVWLYRFDDVLARWTRDEEVEFLLASTSTMGMR